MSPFSDPLGHMPKDLWKLSHTFLGHLPPPPGAKCAHSPCLNLGGQSRDYRLTNLPNAPSMRRRFCPADCAHQSLALPPSSRD